VEGLFLITPIEAASYELLRDQKHCHPTILGLKVNPVHGECFVLPMTAATAAQIATLLLTEATGH
jgi:hypothetical protein